MMNSLWLDERITLQSKQARYYRQADGHDSKNEQSPSVSQRPDQSRPPAHFYGGNGFAALAYQPLLDALSSQFALTSLAMRGYWHEPPTAKRLTRAGDADALIAYLQATQHGSVVGIGHSQGATATAIAAAKRPDLFHSLYLIEPVTFSYWQTKLYDLTPRWLKLHREPFASTLAKQASWQSVTAYYDYLRAHRAFKRISDDHLMTFAQNSLTASDNLVDKALSNNVQAPDGENYRLLFPPEQELANYFGTPYIDGALRQIIKQGIIPITLIIGKPSMFVSEEVRASWRRFIPNERIIVLPDYGHLLPFEAPEQCAALISQLEAGYERQR